MIAMVILIGAGLVIGAGLLVSLIFLLIYRALRGSGRRSEGTATASSRPWLKGGTGYDSGRRSDSEAGAREVELSRRLGKGDLDADAYRQAMTDLTQRDVTRSRGPV
jgi:hypothetical protein